MEYEYKKPTSGWTVGNLVAALNPASVEKLTLEPETHGLELECEFRRQLPGVQILGLLFILKNFLARELPCKARHQIQLLYGSF